MPAFLFIFDPRPGDSRMVRFEDSKPAMEARRSVEFVVPKQVEVVVMNSDELEILPSRFLKGNFREFATVEEAMVEPFEPHPVGWK